MLLLGLPDPAWSIVELGDFEAIAEITPGETSEDVPGGVVVVEWSVFEQLQALQYIVLTSTPEPTEESLIELDREHGRGTADGGHHPAAGRARGRSQRSRGDDPGRERQRRPRVPEPAGLDDPDG